MSEGQPGPPGAGDEVTRVGAGDWPVFGKYSTFASLGEGGMARVYLAALRGPKGFNKLVVVKTIKQELAREPSFVEMFLDEARLAARLNHPNVVHTQEVGEAAGAFFLAMEYLEGQPFSRIFDRLSEEKEALRPAVAARLVSDALAGLHYAHELADYDGRPLQIVHRDISPQNLFVTYDGQVKVVDFGIAKAASRSTETEVGVLKGKLAYMAPEHALGETLDRRADLYAMGIVLWEALTLRRLTAGESASSRLARILCNDVPRVASVVPGIDPRLDDLVTRALDRDPEARFQTAAEMRDALEAWIASAGHVVRQEEIGRRLREMFKEERAAVDLEVKAQMGAVRPVEPPQPAVTSPPPGERRARPASAPRAGPARSGHWGVAAIAGVALASLAGGWLAWARRAPAPSPAPLVDAASSAPRPIAILDAPPPPTTDPEAAAAYTDALRAFRDGSATVAEAGFARAVARDPRLAAAHLRLALLRGPATEVGRASLERAGSLRDLLSPRDLAILAAARLTRDGTQRDAADALSTALPRDAEALLWSGAWDWTLDPGSSRRALELYAQAIEVDPRFAQAYARLAAAQSGGAGWGCPAFMTSRICEGHPEEGIATAERCLAAVPGAPGCLAARAAAHSLLGQCDALERDAKALLVDAPSSPEGYGYMMQALMNRGASVAAVEQLADRHQAVFPEAERAAVALRDRVRLALYTGDFTEAERALAELEKGAAGSPTEANHYAAFLAILVAREEGATSRAASEADAYHGKLPAWSVDLGRNYARVFVIAEELRAGRISSREATEELDAWERASADRLPSWTPAHRWLMRSAAVETAGEAREAVSRAPPDLLPYHVSVPYFRGTLGRLLALDGKAAEAVPYLRAEAAWCGPQHAFDVTFDNFHWLRRMQDRLILGDALERTGDRPGACAEYGIVVERWGHAKPRSVSADRARERAKAIDCP